MPKYRKINRKILEKRVKNALYILIYKRNKFLMKYKCTNNWQKKNNLLIKGYSVQRKRLSRALPSIRLMTCSGSKLPDISSVQLRDSW
jgi:hypothetical protein